MSAGHADNLAPNGLKHNMAVLDGNRIPMAAHKPEMLAGGTIPGLPRIPHAADETRLMEPQHPPRETFTFSGKPKNYRKYYTGA